MNETRRAALSQLAISVDFTRAQVEEVLAAERSDVQALPDNIEDSAFAEHVLKRPMFELAAFGSSYVAAGRTSTKLEQYAREQAEFRQEMRSYMRDRNAEMLALYERQARTEAKVEAQHGMAGQNVNGRK